MSATESRDPDGEQKFSDNESNRIFAHGAHEETIFYTRLNVFLVCESLLFAGVISGLSQPTPARSSLIFMCIVGLLVSVLWWCAQVNKLAAYHNLIDRAKAACPEFKQTLAMPALTGWRGVLQKCGSSTVVAHAFPLLFTGAWAYLIGHLLGLL